MPLQNRVDPFGNLIRTPARGTMMGNRGGALHIAKDIVRKYKSRRWIACVLQFKQRRRIIMSPKRYTELFFLDEAVAFAAGHRPCAECRRMRYNQFADVWQRCHRSNIRVSADEMDRELHAARISEGRKVTYREAVGSLPDGTFVQIEESAYLVWHDRLLLWTPEGYAKREAIARNSTVTVLTPKPIVECFRLGFRPDVHESASEAE